MKKAIEFSIHQGMKSGHAEQAILKYKKIEGKSNIWYVAIQPNEGDNVYCGSRSGKHSDGFGGSTLDFELEDGTIDKVQGPWHSNSSALLDDTEYDVTHKHFTKGIIALDCVNVEDSTDWMKTKHFEVLHYDKEPIIGDFERIDIMAQYFANELKKSIYYAVITSGGGRSKWVNPKN